MGAIAVELADRMLARSESLHKTPVDELVALARETLARIEEIEPTLDGAQVLTDHGVLMAAIGFNFATWGAHYEDRFYREEAGEGAC